MVKLVLSDVEFAPDVFCIEPCKCLLSKSCGASQLCLHGLWRCRASPKWRVKWIAIKLWSGKDYGQFAHVGGRIEHACCDLLVACTVSLPILVRLAGIPMKSIASATLKVS